MKNLKILMNSSNNKIQFANPEYPNNLSPINQSKLRNPLSMQELCPDKSLPMIFFSARWFFKISFSRSIYGNL